MLDVGAKAEQVIAKAEKAVMVYARPDKDHWTEDMAASIARLASITGWAPSGLRGSLCAELEQAAGHPNIDAGLSRLRERMKKNGMRHRDAMALNKLDAVAADGKLRVIVEGIVRKRLAQ